LPVSALDSIYSGEKRLFGGLAAGKYMDSSDFVPRPVINLVVSRPSGSDSKELWHSINLWTLIFSHILTSVVETSGEG
jgi:hypothetical protein